MAKHEVGWNHRQNTSRTLPAWNVGKGTGFHCSVQIFYFHPFQKPPSCYIYCNPFYPDAIPSDYIEGTTHLYTRLIQGNYPLIPARSRDMGINTCASSYLCLIPGSWDGLVTVRLCPWVSERVRCVESPGVVSKVGLVLRAYVRLTHLWLGWMISSLRLQVIRHSSLGERLLEPQDQPAHNPHILHCIHSRRRADSGRDGRILSLGSGAMIYGRGRTPTRRLRQSPVSGGRSKAPPPESPKSTAVLVLPRIEFIRAAFKAQ